MITRFFLFLVVCLLPSIALAAEAAAPAAPSSGWQAVLSFIVQAVAIIVAPILTALGYVGVKRLGLSIERETVEWVVTKAVGYGEQTARKALKAGTPMEGPAILKEALKQGDDLLVKKGLAKKWGSSLETLIEAKLGERKLGVTPTTRKPVTI